MSNPVASVPNFVVRCHKKAKQSVTHKSKQSVTAIQSTNFPNVRLRGSIQKNRNLHADLILGVPTGTPTGVPSRLDSIPGVPTGTPTSVPSRLDTLLGVPTGMRTSVPSRLVRHCQRVDQYQRQRVNQYAALVTKQKSLRPCRKHHVIADSQSIQYRKSLPS